MGLDMYLSARKYVEKIDWDKTLYSTEIITNSNTKPEWSAIVSNAGLSNVASNDIYGVYVSVNVGYWRKANQIHNWFVRNVQNGEDDCGEYYVSRKQLEDLLETCKCVIQTENTDLLPPTTGFFFGNTNIDDYYWHKVKETIKIIENILNNPDAKDLSFYYASSW